MINKFLADIKVIKSAINTKKLVVFAGAGISIDAGVPSWSKLIDEIKNELDLPENEKDFLKIPQIYYNERQEKEYIEKIRKILGHKKLKPNEIHEEIFELNPEHILTTNFEDLLEQVITKKSLPFSVVKEDKDLPYSHNTKLLVKVHGDLDNTNFVLKEDDYLNYSSNHPLIEAFIKSVFASKVVLFVGYSYNDYNLKQIIQSVRNILGNNFQNAYLLSTDKNAHNSHKQYLKNKGINVLDYFDADYNDEKGNTQNYILDFLNGKNVFKEKYLLNNSSFSNKGQLLYNFLRFIRLYDDLKSVITPENVITQTYESLERFSELKSLPQNFIAKIHPFKTLNKNEFLIDQTTLLIKNKTLVDLFYNRILIEGDTLTYKFETDSNIKKNEIDEIEKKLVNIVTKLNNSLIYYITKETSKADSFGYKGFSKDSKHIYLKSKEICQCTKCKFAGFQFNESLLELNNYVITESSDIKEDVQKAYLNYKFGNFVISFNMYEEIASKAWQIGKYITYYIAKNNMKSLKGLIHYNEESIDEDKKEKIINKIADIDTDKLIFQVPYKSNEEYELLKIIRDDSILIEVKNEIENLYNKIENTYKKYKSPYYNEVGPYYPQQVYIQLYKLSNFYTENYIIGDVFSNYKNIIQKGINALLLSHITSKSYSGRLEKLSSDFFKFTILYCDAKNLQNFLNEHEVKEIFFDENGENEILEYCTNYFNSFYSRSTIFFKNSFKNEIVFNQLSKETFETRMKSIFSNMILLLISIKIPDTKKEKFIDDLITFLEFENFVSGDSVKYLNWFIEENYLLFSKENCLRLVKVAHEKTRKYEMYDTLNTIAYISVKNNFEVLIDKDYTLKLLHDYDFYEPRNNVIVYLWQLSNSEIKSELYKKLLHKLDENFNEQLYVIACNLGMLDYNLYFERFLQFINDVNKADKKSNGYSLVDGKYRLDNFIIRNAVIFLYKRDIKSTDVRLQKLTNLTGYMEFYIFRGKFDLKEFKIEWLLLIKSEIVQNEISKIKGLKKIIEKSLNDNYNKEIADIYTKYFI